MSWVDLFFDLYGCSFDVHGSGFEAMEAGNSSHQQNDLHLEGNSQRERLWHSRPDSLASSSEAASLSSYTTSIPYASPSMSNSLWNSA